MDNLVENYFDRDAFVNAMKSVFSEYQISDMISECFKYDTGDFKSWLNRDDEVIILEIHTGVMVGWYKLGHIGRCNICNQPTFDIEDLASFFNRFKESLLDNHLLESSEPTQEVSVDTESSESEEIEEYKMSVYTYPVFRDLTPGSMIYVRNLSDGFSTIETVRSTLSGRDGTGFPFFRVFTNNDCSNMNRKNRLKGKHWPILIVSNLGNTSRCEFDGYSEGTDHHKVRFQAFTTKEEFERSYPNSELIKI